MNNSDTMPKTRMKKRSTDKSSARTATTPNKLKNNLQ